MDCPIEENPGEEFAFVDEDDEKCFSFKSGSLSRVSCNSFNKKMIIDELDVPDWDREKLDIVSLKEWHYRRVNRQWKFLNFKIKLRIGRI